MSSIGSGDEGKVRFKGRQGRFDDAAGQRPQKKKEAGTRLCQKGKKRRHGLAPRCEENALTPLSSPKRREEDRPERSRGRKPSGIREKKRGRGNSYHEISRQKVSPISSTGGGAFPFHLSQERGKVGRTSLRLGKGGQL